MNVPQSNLYSTVLNRNCRKMERFNGNMASKRDLRGGTKEKSIIFNFHFIKSPVLALGTGHLRPALLDYVGLFRIAVISLHLLPTKHTLPNSCRPLGRYDTIGRFSRYQTIHHISHYGKPAHFGVAELALGQDTFSQHRCFCEIKFPTLEHIFGQFRSKIIKKRKSTTVPTNERACRLCAVFPA